MNVMLELLPHTEAAAMIRGKAPVVGTVFDAMVPEIRARAFTVAKLSDLDALQRVRDAIAAIPEGANWEDAKRDVAAELPFTVDPDASPEDRELQAAAMFRKAELLLRTHAFQAYAASGHNTMQATTASHPYWRYDTIGDGRVRDSHAALDGLVLPADSPFWQYHFPPWDWGCRCEAIPLAPEDVERIQAEDADRNPEDRLVIDGERRRRLEEDGELVRGNVRVVDPNDPERKAPLLNENGAPVVIQGGTFDVRPPTEKAESDAARRSAWQWEPGSLHLPLEQIRGRYSDAEWDVFMGALQHARTVDALGGETTVWDWLLEPSREAARTDLLRATRASGTESLVAIDHASGARFGRMVTGDDSSVDAAELIDDARRAGTRVSLEHSHPSADSDMPSPGDLRVLYGNHDAVAGVSVHSGAYRVTASIPDAVGDAGRKVMARRCAAWQTEVTAGRMDAAQWRGILDGLAQRGVVRYGVY